MCVARCIFSLWRYEGYGVRLNVLASDLFKTYQSCIFVFSVYHNCFQSWFFILLYNRGTLFRLTITASCPMDLQYFPMDSQLCYIEIESCKYRHGRAFSSEYSLVFIHKMFLKSVLTKSTLKCHLTRWPSSPFLWITNFFQYKNLFFLSSLMFVVSVGYTMADIRYKWNDGLNSVQVSGDVSLPQFKVLGHRQKTIEASLSTGEWVGILCDWDIFTYSHLNLCVSLTV